jgi:hypothetical protein
VLLLIGCLDNSFRAIRLTLGATNTSVGVLRILRLMGLLAHQTNLARFGESLLNYLGALGPSMEADRKDGTPNCRQDSPPRKPLNLFSRLQKL